LTGGAGAHRYFDRVPSQWDALYSRENPLRALLNRVLRPGLYRRHRATWELCGDISGERVLDLGCGTGRYSVESALRGAERVVGIDFAPAMVAFAREAAAAAGVGDRCEFLCGDVHVVPEDTFDVVLALGLFDYIRDPTPLFEVIAALRPRVFVASFPKFTPLWGTQRFVRYRLIHRCPVYDYRRGQLLELCRRAGFDWTLVSEGRHGLLAAAGMKAPASAKHGAT
jgi:SAM-dependent methyltransferase